MATHLQQSQVSGSLAGSVDDNFGADKAVGLGARDADTTLVKDLNDLRKQINRIIGNGGYRAGLDNGKDLKTIYADLVSEQSVRASADLSLAGLVSTEVVDRSNAISAEASTRLAGDNSLAALISTEVVDRSAAVSAEASTRLAGDNSLAALVSTEVVDRSNAVSAEASTRLAGDNSLAALISTEVVDRSNAVSAEASTRLAGDNSLAALISTEVVDRSAAVSSEASLRVAGDSSLAALISTEVVDRSAAVSSEASLRVAGDNSLAALISTEVVDRSAAVSAEASTRLAGDNSLAALISTEVVDRSNAVSAEASTRLAGDNSLAALISTESSDRVAGDSSLAALISTEVVDRSNAVSAEASTRLAADNSLAALISTEVVDRSAAVSAEASTRLAADNSLAALISTEVVDRSAAVSSEASTRLAADNSLAALISGEVSRAQSVEALKLDLAGGTMTGDLIMSASIKIAGDVAQRLYIVDGDGSIKDEEKLTFDNSKLFIDGDLKVGGNDILDGNGDVVMHFAGDGSKDVSFKGDVIVDGDLQVKGAMTYIETSNLRVEDAFIYLATGSNGTTDSGIVLHGGAGASMDLVMGQDGGAGEFIFGKGNRAPDGDGAMNGIDLVPAWMGGLKLGGNEGTMSGSLVLSGSGIAVKAVGDMFLESNGTVYELADAGDLASFNSAFGAGTTIIAALAAAGAGGANFVKKSFTGAALDLGNNKVDFSQGGTVLVRTEDMASAELKEKKVDVYLNGMLLTSGVDYNIAAARDKIEFVGIALNSDDVVTVVLRNAA